MAGCLPQAHSGGSTCCSSSRHSSLTISRSLLIESPRILVSSVVSKRRHMLYKNCQNSLRLLVPVHYVLYSLGVDELARVAYGRGYAYSIQYHIVWCVEYRRKIIAPSFVHPSALYSKHAQSTKGCLCTIALESASRNPFSIMERPCLEPIVLHCGS